MLLFSSKLSFKEKIKKVFLKYWTPGLISLTTGILACYAFQKENTNYFSYIAIGVILTFLSLAVSMLLTTFKTKKIHFILHYIFLIISGVGFFLLFNGETSESAIYKYLLSGIFTAFFVLFAPYILNSSNKDFLLHLKSLILNWVMITVFGGIIMFGISIFLLMLNFLFEIKYTSSISIQAMFLVWSILCFWLFAALLPLKFKDREEDKYWSKIFNFLTAYLLVPFSVLYAILIYVYSFSILITGVLPTNKIVSFLSILYVLILVSYIFLFKSENKIYKFIKRYLRIFIIVCLPLVIVFFIAISARIRQYGFTEDRLLVLIFGIIVTLLSLYFAINKKIQLRLIPAIIGVFLLLMSFGPWSLTNITLRDQIKQYENFLIENQFIINGQVNEDLHIERYSDVGVKLRQKTTYLARRFGAESLNPYFQDIMYLEPTAVDVYHFIAVENIINYYTKPIQ